MSDWKIIKMKLGISIENELKFAGYHTVKRLVKPKGRS